MILRILERKETPNSWMVPHSHSRYINKYVNSQIRGIVFLPFSILCSFVIPLSKQIICSIPATNIHQISPTLLKIQGGGAFGGYK